jgi:polysaccharide deacetylase family protein (PEP-CTERM system associated)
MDMLMNTKPITHAMTVDVEDYYHVAAFAKVIKPQDWDQWPSRVEANTDKLLQLFADRNIKITFFILGWVAEKYPDLVKRIHSQGHEIASHGYSHQLIYKQTPEVFRAETVLSKQILEGLIQTPVIGYRAASYSITSKSLWALDTLAELGFTWDSSIFPTRHDNYGIPGSPEEPYKIITTSGASLTEFPLTTAKVLGQSVPAAGGGYFRQYPYALSRWDPV